VRNPDWLPRLEAAVARARALPFAWGRHDCCLFPCDVVRAMTGVDLARGWRGRYRSLLGARRMLRRRGGLKALAEGVARRHGLAEIPPATARRGDVVLLDASSLAGRFALGPAGSGSACLAVVDLTGAAALTVAAPDATGGGLVEVPMPLWRRAWRIA